MPTDIELGWIWLAVGILLVGALMFGFLALRRARTSRFNRLDAAFNRARVSRQVNAGYKPMRK